MSVSYPSLDRTIARLRGAFWRRRFLRGLVRAMWLALLVPTIVMAGYLWFNWQIPLTNWAALSLLLAFAAIAWAMRPIDPRKMAIRLDEIMGLRSQLITAYEVTHPSNPAEPVAANPVTNRLLQEGVAHTVQMRQKVRFLSRGFWLELHTLILILAFLVAMLLLDALAVTTPDTAPMNLPTRGKEPRAQEVAPQNSELGASSRPQGRGVTKAQLQDALDALADALRDQAVTRAAADALDRGDVPGAAEAIDIVAKQVGALSEPGRIDLGNALQQAADNIDVNVPDLTRPLERGSRALLRGDIPGSSRELENLADALDAIADTMSAAEIPADEPNQSVPEEQPPSDEQTEAETDESLTEPGDGAGGQETDSGEDKDTPLGEKEERLPIDGQPLELESGPEQEESVLQPSDLGAEADGTSTADSPFARQPLNAAGDDLGADPLTYPWEKREIIQNYFTPK